MKGNPVVWFEIYVQDMPRAKAFYEKVLGTTLDEARKSRSPASKCGRFRCERERIRARGRARAQEARRDPRDRPGAARAARRATKTVPLVMVASSADPVAEGVAASLARPEATSRADLAEPDRFKKQLELLKAAAPRIRASPCCGTSTPTPTVDSGGSAQGGRPHPRPRDPGAGARAQRGRAAGRVRLVRQRQGDAILVAAGGPILPRARRSATSPCGTASPASPRSRNFRRPGCS